MNFEWLLKARDYLRIASHSSGTLKIKVNPAILSSPEFSKLPKFDEMPKGVDDVKVSIFTQTITIRYQPDVIPSALLDELFTADEERGSAILADLQTRLGVSFA
ncbi:heavy-metal-associated domain-containing protein [Desulfobaculum bizertense]|uniref:Uncharacterized protein n=1 Tax=Desulfobaculum bizertense DSM 18034 TaxID=1121442 RepID=A0A1T4VNR4_9BACT|nr:heavy-metal-associated domain-containing protein [Desulfobaculum bizertense]UIJ38150.1 heavy-metal-associated domain-containing protein [Desulfobaculum bizertense]SKA66586.1 hypothetical protein SAMN02745702_00625 [Desulfobaculum bizertense DSM 18034]